MGHFGFSYVGLIFLTMLMVPNFLWAKRQPEGYTAANENKVLLALERLGEVAVTCILLCFENFNLRPWSNRSWWLVLSFVLMVCYELYWIRYFRSPRKLSDFYLSFLFVPLAGASLPVIAAFCLGLYGGVVWLLIASVILGIGHIGIHDQHKRELQA